MTESPTSVDILIYLSTLIRAPPQTRMKISPSQNDELHQTVSYSFDGVHSKDGGEAESVSASDASSISAPPVDKPPQDSSWVWISALLVLSTLLQSVKPSEPYVPQYWEFARGLTNKETKEGPAYRSYAMTIMLPVVSYASEYFIGYVPPIVFGLLCRWICQFTWYYGNTFAWFKASYAIFGLSHSTKTIYSAFTYTMVPVQCFHQITSYIRCANFVAHVVGGSLGNLIFDHAQPGVAGSDKLFSYMLMFSVSQICVGLGVVAFIIAIVLNYFYKVGSSDALANIKPPAPKSLQEAKLLLQQIYHSTDIRIWSLWYIFSFAIVDALWDYQPMLFGELKGKDLKGFVMAGTRLACAAAAILAGRSRSLYARCDLIIITVSGGIVAVSLGLQFGIHNLYQVYGLFFITMMVNEFCICGVTAQIAMKTQQSLRGVILLLNMIFAMIFQSVMQSIFNNFALNIFYRYLGLSICMFAFTAGMLFYMFGHYGYVFCRNIINRNRQQPSAINASSV